jgi:hypothetical protein
MTSKNVPRHGPQNILPAFLYSAIIVLNVRLMSARLRRHAAHEAAIRRHKNLGKKRLSPFAAA